MKQRKYLVQVFDTEHNILHQYPSRSSITKSVIRYRERTLLLYVIKVSYSQIVE